MDNIDNVKHIADLVAGDHTLVPNLQESPEPPNQTRVSQDQSSSIAECACEPQNDTGNGQRLLKYFGSEILHVREIGWHAWHHTHWEREVGEESTLRFAQRTAGNIVLEAEHLVATPSEEKSIKKSEAVHLEYLTLKKTQLMWGNEEKARAARFLELIIQGSNAVTALQKRQIARRKFGVSSGNTSRTIGMIAQALPHRTVAPDALNANPRLFNVENGTLAFKVEQVLDLECPDPDTDRFKTSCHIELRPHCREDLITRVAPVSFDEKATCPLFDAFLFKFQPNENIRRFLQTYHGYAILGDAGEQCLVFNHGLGANGKSTFIELICRIMGPYAQTLPFESLAGENGRRGDQATPDIARLPGSRLVRASEPERNVRFKESLLKSLTGGEPMVARHLHKGFFDFRPVFKLVLSGNQRPEIGGVDHGIWRRMRLVPWDVTITEEERRPIEGVLADFWKERAGILNWLVQGAVRYLCEGLVAPKEILDATALYRGDMDPLGAFIRACVEVVAPALGGPKISVTAREMYEAFCAWCDANSVKPWSEKTFGITMPQKGLKKTDERIRRYLNVRLHDVPPRDRKRNDDPSHLANDEVPT